MTPQGSLTYSQTGTNSDGTPQYTQTQTLSPSAQAQLDQQNQVATALDGIANTATGQVAATQANPLSFSGDTPLQTSIAGNNPYTLQSGPAAGPVQTNVAPSGTIQNSLDYSGLSTLPDPTSFNAADQTAANSVYSQAASRLDPQWANSNSDLASSLAAQGISANSPAYQRAMQTQSEAQTDAYNQANYSAIQEGQAVQAQQYGQALSTVQQQQNEVDTQGNFANSAQAQQYGQNLSDAQLFNAANQQQFSQGQSAAELNNENQNQEFNQNSAEATFNNQARQTQEQEQAYLYSQPINNIAALLGTAGGVAQPDFAPVSQVGVAAPDYSGLVQSNYNAATSQYNQQQASQAQALGSIFGAAGTAAAGYLSDMRFKENIRRIGTLANGLGTYAFNYIGNKAQQFGVMAQEVLSVIPEAVMHDADGVMYVDYGKVY